MADTVIVSTANSAMDDYPLFLQAAGGDPVIQFSGQDYRNLVDALFTSEGVLGPASFVVTQRGAGANFSVDISAGRAVILGDDVASQGKYLVRSTGVVNVPTPSAPGAGTRVHRLVARIRDKLALGSGTYDWVFHLLEDTGSGTPALPASAVHLRLIWISAGQASVQTQHITDAPAIAQTYNSGGLIAEATVGVAAAGSVSFQGIPATYRHLMIVAQCRGTDATSYTDVFARFNNDSGSNYVRTVINADDTFTSPTSGGAISQNALGVFRIPAASLGGLQNGGGGFAWVHDYSGTLWRDKALVSLSSGAIATSMSTRIWQSTWVPASPTAVNRVDLFPVAGSFTPNSYFGVYGIG